MAQDLHNTHTVYGFVLTDMIMSRAKSISVNKLLILITVSLDTSL